MAMCEKLFSRLKSGLQKHRKIAVFSIALVCVFVGVNFAFAEPPTDTGWHEKVFVILMGGIGTIINAIAWGVGQLILIIIGGVLIPILGYNSFGTSNVVGLGWSLVRDVVNMFVVIIILVIAVQTILGVKKANWQQQLPRLFIAVVAVNFSKTITLFLIDIGQVIMFTFVNALRDIAAGNFVNLFQLNKFYEVSSAAADATIPFGGLEAFGYLATAYLTLTLMLSVLGVLILMTLIFLYRVVILWVLIILSPAAFFAAGNKGLLDTLGSSYTKWWNKLVGAITLGPILAFFLWLALAMASGGPVSTAENFPTPSQEDTAGQNRPYTEIFEDTGLLSLFLALVMLMVGFQVASGAAQQVGGVAATFVTEKGGRALVGGAARLPARVAGRGIAKVSKETGFTRGVVGAAGGAGAAMSRSGVSLAARGGFANRLAGGMLVGAGAGVKRRTDKLESAEHERVKKQVAGMTTEEFQFAMQGGGVGDSARRATELARDQFATRSQSRKDLRMQMGDSDESKETYREHTVAALKRGDDQVAQGNYDENQKKAFDKFKAENVHMLEDRKEQERIVRDPDLRKRISKEAAADKGIRALAEETVVDSYKDKDGNIIQTTAADQYRTGKGVSSEVRDAFAAPDLEAANAGEIASGLASGKIDIEKITKEQLEGANADNLFKGIIEAREKGVDASRLRGDALLQFKQRAEELRDSATLVDQRKIDRAMFGVSGNKKTIGVNDNGSIDQGMRLTVREEIKINPQNIGSFKNNVNNDKRGEGISYEISQVVDRSVLDSIDKRFGAATNDAEKGQMRDSIDTIIDALNKRVAGVQSKGGNTKQLTELLRRADSIRRIMN